MLFFGAIIGIIAIERVLKLKKLFCAALIFALIMSLCGCLKNDVPNVTSEQENTVNSENDGRFSENSSTDSSNISQNSAKLQGSTSQTVTSSSGTVVEKPITPTANDESISSPEIEQPSAPDTPHIPLSKESYYQYSRSSVSDRQVYRDICTAIETTQNVISLEKYSLSTEKLEAIYAKVTADNPQYFWVTKFITYSAEPSSGKDRIVTLYLFYTDGETIDTINGSGKLTKTADRKKISQQISQFNAKAEEFLKTVSSTLSDLEKEKLIHDFVLKNITYDYDAVSVSPSRENYLRAWDTYGALCENKAVCEGYTRLFQYLCYQVGINATYVQGTSQGVGHAWNVIKLDGDWYHIDTTWDDGSTDNQPLYNWFNLTEAEIKVDHTITYDNLYVPTAEGTEYSLKNTFAMSIENSTDAPYNYQKAIDYMVKFDDTRITVLLNGNTLSSSYLYKHLLGDNSTVGKYIKSKGYNLKFENSYLISGDGKYMYLQK